MTQIINSFIEIISFIILILGFIAAIEGIIFAAFKIFAPKSKICLPIMLVIPAFLGLLSLIGFPMVFEAYIAVTNLTLATIGDWARGGSLEFVGLKNFIDVFTQPPMQETGFFALIGRTIWWTVVNVFFHVLGGTIIALLLNNRIRLRGFYRMLIIIPWAMPQVVAVLAWRGEFHSQFGFINIMIQKLVEVMPFLASMGLGPMDWYGEHNFLMCCIVNIWLGIPFMAVIILGGLQSISPSYYAAAAIDGASAWQRFRYITLPLLKPVVGPAVTMGTIWTFNNVSVIYLLTNQGGGGESADILVSALYKAAFNYFRYGYAAAFSFVIFILLMFFALVWTKTSKALDEVY